MMTQVKMRYIMGTLVTLHRNSLTSLIDQFSNPMICRKTSAMFFRIFPVDYLLGRLRAPQFYGHTQFTVW